MKKIIHVFILCLLMLSSNAFSAEKKLTITVHEEWSSSLGILKELLSESYKELGYEVVFRDLPPARALYELKYQKVDGDMARTDVAAHEYNAILVPPPYFTLNIFAYYELSRFTNIPSIEEIKKGKVGYINGSFAVEKFLQNAQSTIGVKNYSQLIGILKLHRVDYIIPSTSVPIIDNELGKILLFKVAFFHILTEKNKDLAKKLEPILRKNMSKKKYTDLEARITKLILEKSK